MRANFDACLRELLRHEGGYVNDPRDPGGETNMGISKRAYPREDIRGMTRARAAEIYRRDYWAPIRGDDLPDGLDAVAFDAAVNSGVSRSAKWLQAAVGATPDGKIGPATIAAARSIGAPVAINRALDVRLKFMRGLSTWPTFGRGWQRRVDELRVFAMDLAQPITPPPATMPRPVDPRPVTPAAQPPAAVWIIAAIVAVALIILIGR